MQKVIGLLQNQLLIINTSPTSCCLMQKRTCIYFNDLRYRSEEESRSSPGDERGDYFHTVAVVIKNNVLIRPDSDLMNWFPLRRFWSGDLWEETPGGERTSLQSQSTRVKLWPLSPPAGRFCHGPAHFNSTFHIHNCHVYSFHILLYSQYQWTSYTLFYSILYSILWYSIV